MEMLYFTLGVLSVVALIFVGVVIVGMVKVSRLSKEISSLTEQTKLDAQNIYRLYEDQNRYINERFMEVAREINTLHSEATSYTDRRVDKMIENLRN